MSTANDSTTATSSEKRNHDHLEPIAVGDNESGVPARARAVPDLERLAQVEKRAADDAKSTLSHEATSRNANGRITTNLSPGDDDGEMGPRDANDVERLARVEKEAHDKEEEPAFLRSHSSRSSRSHHTTGADSDDEHVPRSPPTPTSPTPAAGTRPPSPYSSHPFSPATLAILAPSSMFGLLARLGIQALVGGEAHYGPGRGESVFPLAWVQGMGCFVMGLAVGGREAISQIYAPFYFALATGFCGSLTTFSSWNLDMFLAWENASGYHRVWLYDIIDGLTQFFITLAVSLSALSLGLHTSSLILPHVPLSLPALRSPTARWTLTILSLAAYCVAIPLYFVLSPAYRAQATAALLFAYPGALARHVLSIKLNPINKTFPIGTFIANITATLLIGIFHTSQHSSSAARDALGCVMLQALMDGLCGCLSTVSTFAVEVRALKGRAWRYVGASVGLAQMILLLVVGAPWWGGAISEQKRAMCTFER